MLSTKQMEDIMSLLLIFGMLISAGLVTLGGAMYLYQHGMESLHTELLQAGGYHINIKLILKNALSFTPLGIIELGLLTLIGTQVLRVALLVWFYAFTRDTWFTFISVFILITLVYSLVWRH
jgi:uncharacterized membrane protein